MDRTMCYYFICCSIHRKYFQYYTINNFSNVLKFSFQFMRGSEGLPVNVQVAALPWQEELVLRIMKEIQTDLKK